MAKFVVLTDKITSIQQNALTLFVKEKGWEFWHWFENAWFLAGGPESLTAEQIWLELESLESLQGASIVIMQVSDPIRYWGRSPKESWEWMVSHWGTPAR